MIYGLSASKAFVRRFWVCSCWDSKRALSSQTDWSCFKSAFFILLNLCGRLLLPLCLYCGTYFILKKRMMSGTFSFHICECLFSTVFWPLASSKWDQVQLEFYFLTTNWFQFLDSNHMSGQAWRKRIHIKFVQNSWVLFKIHHTHTLKSFYWTKLIWQYKTPVPSLDGF